MTTLYAVPPVTGTLPLTREQLQMKVKTLEFAARTNAETIREQQKHIRFLEADIANTTRTHQNAVVELEGGRCLSLAAILESNRYWERCYGCKDAECRPTEFCYARRRAMDAEGDDRE